VGIFHCSKQVGLGHYILRKFDSRQISWWVTTEGVRRRALGCSAKGPGRHSLGVLVLLVDDLGELAALDKFFKHPPKGQQQPLGERNCCDAVTPKAE